MSDLQNMGEHPAEDPEHQQAFSVRVAIVYADGHTARGYFDYWTGWTRLDSDGIPQAIEYDDDQPIGWRAL